MQEGALTGAGAGLGAQPGPWQPPQGPHVYGMPWSGAAFLPTGPLLGAGPSLWLCTAMQGPLPPSTPPVFGPHFYLCLPLPSTIALGVWG